MRKQCGDRLGYIFAIIAVPVILGLLALLFVSSEPKSILGFVRYLFPVLFVACGLLLTIAGLGALGFPALALGIIWWWDISKKAKLDG